MAVKLYSEPLLFTYTFIYTSLIMIIPQLFLANKCLEKYDNLPDVCPNIEKYPDYQRNVQQNASFWTMIYHLILNVLGLFTVLLWGPVTDIVGRKGYFVYTCVTMIVMNLILITAIKLPSISTVLTIFVAILNGSYADFSGTISMCYTAMADATDESNRTFRMAILGSMQFFAFGIGGLVTGIVTKRLGFIFNPILNVALLVATLLYVVFYLKDHQKFDSEQISESSNKSRCSLSILNPIPHFKDVVMVVYLAKKRYFLAFMYFMFLAQVIGESADHYLMALYITNKPFNASAEVVGYYVSFFGLSGFIGAIISVLVAEKLHIKDEPILKFGFLCQLISYILIGAARTKTGVFLARIVQIPTPLAMTTLVSYTTKFADDDKKYGSICAGLHALDVLTCILASFFVGIVYSSTLNIHSGITYFILGGVNFIALLAFFYLARQVKKARTNEDEKAPLLSRNGLATNT